MVSSDTVPDETQTLDTLAASVAAKIDCKYCLISVVDEDTHCILGHSAPSGEAGERFIDAKNTICIYTAHLGEPVRLSNIEKHEALKAFAAQSDRIRAYLGVPLLLAGERCVGAMCCVSETPRIWSDGDLKFMIDAAQIVANQIEFFELRGENLALDGTVREFDRIISALSQTKVGACSVHDEAGELLFSNRALANGLGLAQDEVEQIPCALRRALRQSDPVRGGDMQVDITVPGRPPKALMANCEPTKNGVMLCEWSVLSSA